MWERASSSRSSRATASSAIGAAKEAARDAGAALWASLMGDEMEAGQQQEPMVECDDWGLYYQALDGGDYHHSSNLR